MKRSFPLWFVCAALAAGCGRTSLLGEYDNFPSCRPGEVRDAEGRCVPAPDLGGRDLAGRDLGRDLGRDMRDAGDGGDGGEDGGDDMALPCEQRREQCGNNVDDNCDGRTDCRDPQCAGDPLCVKPGQEICNNGVDDDVDGLVDCKDDDCDNFPGCMVVKCDPLKPDCASPACVNEPKCKNLLCNPTVDFGVLKKNDSKSQQSVSTVGTMDVAVTPCAPGGAGMVVSELTIESDATTVRLDFTQSMNGDHVFSLFREGIGQKCDANPLGCYDPKSAPKGTTTYTLDKGHYFLIVQAFSKAHQGTVDVTLTTPPLAKPEICGNGVDDDMNGLVDCADPTCKADPSCKLKQCNPDVIVGTLVVGGAPKQATVMTRGGGSDQQVDCAAGKGEDRVIQFSLKETAGVLVRWGQMGDHVMALFRKPGPGNNCDAIPLGCYIPQRGGAMQPEVAWGDLPPGDYFFIFQAVKPGGEGSVDVELSAFRNRKVELCHNLIDDDADGLIDCGDPDCFADPGCGSPICQPDVDLGTLQIGDQKSTVIDTKSGIPNLQVSCAKGGGKTKVVQLTLAKASGMGFGCTQTGDHVLGLFAQAGFRDGCDKTEVSCGDPKTIPFGCGYVIPNLQPGTYYVLVTAFQAGTEGRVNLTLSSENDRALEVCNNKIDDDMDGFTDCADRKCATSPYCAARACMADATVDPLPLNGMAVFKLVQTAGKQVTAQPACEDKPGGGNAVVLVNMPGKGTLKVEYTQVGNHVFALHPVIGNGLICEAAKSLSCQKSMGQGGTATFPNLAAGKYWLIIAATQPGDEGSAALKFTGMP